MALDFNLMVGGEAGQGVQSIGLIIAKIIMRGGYEVFCDQDYESRIRGGHSFARVRVSDKRVRSVEEKVNILVALNKDTVDIHHHELKPEGESVIIFDQEKAKGEVKDSTALLNVPMERIAVETTGNKIMANSVATGAAMGLIDYDFSLLARMLQEEFSHHGEQVANDNVKAAQAGYDYGQKNRIPGFKPRLKAKGQARRMLLDGNDALSFAALAAGCKFVAGYPMTPTSSIIEYIADKGRPFNVKVIQAEDEISAMNMAVGAGYAGVRAMTATSGGGFCLMVEAISLAGMTETPVVVVLGMRPGPAIGLPTRTEQGELFFALHAGHGEFPRAVLAPTNVEDAFCLTAKAFNLAEKYQSPVIIITDQHLAESFTSTDRFDLSQVKIDRGELMSEEESNNASDYKRYRFTESGVSPRALPMVGKALVVADSDEHNEEGHIIEDAETRRKMVMKRMHKLEGIRSELGKPIIHEQPGARANLVGWGSTYGAIKEAQDLLADEGIPVNVVQFNELWPFPGEAATQALGDSIKTVVIENNYTGQFERLLRQETGIKAAGHIHKFDGRPFTARYIIDELKKEAVL